jgi:adenylate cyclase
MAEERVQRKLTAILAADVVGYSRLMGQDEGGTRARFNAHLNELIEPTVESRRGRIVKTTGDALLVEFASVVDAVECAIEIQNGMAERNRAEADDRQIVFRIGVNLGDVIVEGDDIHGDGVNVAARLEALADPGSVVISDKVHSETRTKLDVNFDDLGSQEVKNIAEPIHGDVPPTVEIRSAGIAG